MEKPYLVCHMVSSADGRIDCAMTEKLPGVSEYYSTLDELDAPSTISGRETAQLEMAFPGIFESETKTLLHKTAFRINSKADSYEIVTDSKGILLWNPEDYLQKPLLILTSEDVSREYLDYLDANKISWIAAGTSQVDLKQAMALLKREFGIQKAAVVGGAHINGGFLKENLLDEISLLIGPGIDGRQSMPAVFDGLPSDFPLTLLKLKDVKSYGDGAVWIRWTVLPSDK